MKCQLHSFQVLLFELSDTSLNLCSVMIPKSVSADKSHREAAREFTSVRAVAWYIGCGDFLEFWIAE